MFAWGRSIGGGGIGALSGTSSIGSGGVSPWLASARQMCVRYLQLRAGRRGWTWVVQSMEGEGAAVCTLADTAIFILTDTRAGSRSIHLQVVWFVWMKRVLVLYPVYIVLVSCIVPPKWAKNILDSYYLHVEAKETTYWCSSWWIDQDLALDCSIAGGLIKMKC